MKREEKSEQSKEKIIQAALQEFGQCGYETASTNNMCKQHNISKGLLFHHYASKDELFLVCVKRCFEALAERLKEVLPEQASDAKESLNQYFEIRFEFFKAYPLYEQIFYTAIIHTPAHLKEEIEVCRAPLNQLNHNYLSKLLDQVALKEEYDKNTIIELLNDMSHYLHMKYKGDCLSNLQERHELVMQHSKAIKNMILIFFYGVTK